MIDDVLLWDGLTFCLLFSGITRSETTTQPAIEGKIGYEYIE